MSPGSLPTRLPIKEGAGRPRRIPLIILTQAVKVYNSPGVRRMLAQSVWYDFA